MYYNYEAALRWAGVPLDQIYPATEKRRSGRCSRVEEIKLARCRLVDFRRPAAPVALYGEVVLAMAWNGRRMLRRTVLQWR